MTNSVNYQELTKKISTLANLPIPEAQTPAFAAALGAALDVIDELSQINVIGIEPTTRVSRGTNRWRPDEIDRARMFTQAQALENAPQTHRGYFVAERLIDHEA